jgi:hypothetical protein
VAHVRSRPVAKTTNADDKKRLDPVDARKEAARRDEPMDKRSSPGSGEDEDVNGTADLQPDDVEGEDPAR